MRWLAVLLVVAGCRQPRSEAGRTDLPDTLAATGRAELQDPEPGVEFDAPRLIPAIRAQITEMEDRKGATEENLTAFKDAVGTLVDAMESDLNRVGAGDGGGFEALRDSISEGSGSGAAARVIRLIELYEERMRTAAR